jgi:NADH-quinone oxidoreductase subunit J
MSEPFVFWPLVLMAIPFALGVVFARNLVYSAICLLVVFIALAGLFALNGAEFLAVAQIMVYAVGLTIVLLFGLMFTGDKPLPVKPSNIWVWLTSLGVLGLFLAQLIQRVAATAPALAKIQGKALAIQSTLDGSRVTEELGKALFNKYVLPFEVVSILLLAAMVGAIVFTRKQNQDDVEGTLTFKTAPKRITEATRQFEEELNWGQAPSAGSSQVSSGSGLSVPASSLTASTVSELSVGVTAS